MALADRIQEAMDARDLSRTALSKASGVPYPTLAGILNGHQEGTTKLPELAAALGVNPFWLSTGRGPRDLQHGTSAGVREDAQSYDADAAILKQAESWVAFEESPGRFQPMRRLERTMELVQQIKADGGFLSPERARELIEAKRQQLGGANDGKPSKGRRPEHGRGR